MKELQSENKKYKELKAKNKDMEKEVKKYQAEDGSKEMEVRMRKLVQDNIFLTQSIKNGDKKFAELVDKTDRQLQKKMEKIKTFEAQEAELDLAIN